MRLALADGGVVPEQVGYINAHGTSTHLNDSCETTAIKTVFGGHAYKLAVSSTKSMTGHLLGGAGGIEAVFTALALHDAFLPPPSICRSRTRSWIWTISPTMGARRRWSMP